MATYERNFLIRVVCDVKCVTMPEAESVVQEHNNNNMHVYNFCYVIMSNHRVDKMKDNSRKTGTLSSSFHLGTRL